MDNDFTNQPPDSLSLPDVGLEFVDHGPGDNKIAREIYADKKIVVLGLGGCGNNAINHMVASGLQGPYFAAANSDLQDLNRCRAKIKIPIGVKTAEGHGCGGDPEMGRLCAEENIEEIKHPLKDADMTFLMAGLGGGTGSGAIPVVAEALSKMENPPLVVGVVTRPFPWEDYRDSLTEDIIKQLRGFCNSVIIIPNTRLCELYPDLAFMEAKGKVDDILLRAVSSIVNLIEKDGVINLGFADVAEVMRKKGVAIMGFGEAVGEKRAQLALREAIANPLMGEISLKGARGVLVNIASDQKIKTSEMTTINTMVYDMVGQDVEFFCGWEVDESLAETGALRVTVVATGLDQEDDDDLAFSSGQDLAFNETLDEGADGEVEVDIDADDLDLPLDAFDSLDENSLVILEPVDEPLVGSGHLAPVVNQRPPQSATAPHRPTPLSPVETLSPVYPTSPITLTSARSRLKDDNALDLSQVHNRGEFYDVHPSYRDKKK
ncbi:MAG: cell division FtsZ family protein [Deltaproteobacteria bacterium]|jgi:cell division protein FtsZ|nr:cell division FtsZ family protein [Deltaproteobacteria bacterium]